MSAELALMAFRAMAADDMQGGTVTYGATDYQCTVGVFKRQDVLTAGGWSPDVMGTIEVAREDFSDPSPFKIGEELTVTPTIGTARDCHITAITEMGSLIQIEVKDINQNA